jgi:hypothetical protein
MGPTFQVKDVAEVRANSGFLQCRCK